MDVFELPENAQYGDCDITEIAYNLGSDAIFVQFECEKAHNGWDQLIFSNCKRENGQAIVNPDGVPVGLMPPEQALDSDTPGGNEAETLYDLLEDIGISVY